MGRIKKFAVSAAVAGREEFSHGETVVWVGPGHSLIAYSVARV